MEEPNSHSNQNSFYDRRATNYCPSHDRTLNEIRELYDRTGETSSQVQSVTTNLSLLIKILSGTVVIAAAMVGTIYLSVAKIDKQVATIVTTVHNQEKQNERVEKDLNKLQGRVLTLEMKCQRVKNQLENN